VAAAAVRGVCLFAGVSEVSLYSPVAAAAARVVCLVAVVIFF